MKWPWKRHRRQLEEARSNKERAELREREVQPLANRLHKHDRVNHLSARVRASWLGGQH